MSPNERERRRINKIIRDNWNKCDTYSEVASLSGLTADKVRKRGFRMGLPSKSKNIKYIEELTPEKLLQREIIDKNTKIINQYKENKEKILISKLEQKEKELEALKSIQDIEITDIKPKNLKTGKLVAVAVASDWHYYETVNPEQIDYLNSFNKDIAYKRATNFFSSIVKLVELFNGKKEIETLVLALLGDFISGNIHDELLESNQGLVIDELIAVQNVICSGIEYLLRNTDLNIIIPCHSGNHSRVTKKTHIATEAGNSLEYLMYTNIAKYFKNEERIEFRVSRGYLSYLDLNGYVIRFHHGHAVKYGGGIGGLFIPAFKSISQWNKGKYASLDCFGHFHQIKDGGNFVTNGSLVGYNDFALRIKADFEKPKQLFFLIDTERKEKTVTTSIFLE